MPSNPLENLARIGQLKAEPRSHAEVSRLLGLARTRLADAQLASLSLEGRFTSAYNAAHSAALAALRWHGFRSENRFTVFQCLVHTVNWPPQNWRVLDLAHQKRNLAEYEGYMDEDEALLASLLSNTEQLCEQIEMLRVKVFAC